MRRFIFILIVMSGWFTIAASAQDVTNAPKTEIENFELQTDTVIVKGFSEVGSVTTAAGVISVRCKESTDTTTGSKQYGLALVLESNPERRQSLIVDYDELDSLVRGLDYLGKITYDVTTLPAFDAAITTKSGVRFAAHSERRQGGIQTFVQFGDLPRIPLSSDQFNQFENLIVQAKNSLDALKNK